MGRCKKKTHIYFYYKATATRHLTKFSQTHIKEIAATLKILRGVLIVNIQKMNLDPFVCLRSNLVLNGSRTSRKGPDIVKLLEE